MVNGGRRFLPALLTTVLAISCLVCQVSESAHTFLDLLEDRDDIKTLLKGANFLVSYGYITPEIGFVPPEEMDSVAISTAIRKMQKYAAVNQTGKLDRDTMRMMNTSRCGVHDEPEELRDTRIEKYASDDAESGELGGDGSHAHRRRRYAVAGLQYKWNKNDITYKITNYPDGSTSKITPAQVRRDTERAFKVWSDATPLTFTEVDIGEKADIKLLFGAYDHTNIQRDPRFDGPGGTLGHAFFPNSNWGDADGDVHLDDSETFTHQEYFGGTDYFYTVTHEIGHALGMSHATEKSSLMFPYDKGYIPDFVLPEDDTQGIQLLYGPNPVAESRSIPVVEHEICSRGVDSLTMINRELHVFSGNKFWKLSRNNDILAPVEGTVSREYFKKLQKRTTAVYTRHDGMVVFFRGRNYWVYDGRSKEQNAGLKMADLGVPKSPTAVMQDRDQRHTYFFKWYKVWKYDERAQRVVDGFPAAAHKVFEGLPPKSKVQAAYTDKRGDRYLLVGRQYYRFPNGQDQLDPDYPKDFLVEYFGCQPQ